MEGVGFFHSHCRTLCREQSQHCASLHSLVFPHGLGLADGNQCRMKGPSLLGLFLGSLVNIRTIRSVNGKVLVLEALA